MKNQDPETLNVEEVAALLSVATGTVYEWAAMDYIPFLDLATNKKQKCLRFDKDDVLQWRESKKSKGRVNRIP